MWDPRGVGCLFGPEAVVAGPLVEAEEDEQYAYSRYRGEEYD